MSAEPSIRSATDRDRDSIHALDAICFPADDVNTQAAAPGELEQGIRDGTLYVAEQIGTTVGYLQYSMTHHAGGPLVFIGGVGVHPDARGQGIARALLQHLLSATRRTGPTPCRYATTTAPKNIAMIRLLCSLGFEGIDYIEDYFGPGRDRIYFEREASGQYQQRSDPVLVPVAASKAAVSLLSSSERHVLGVVELPHGWHYEITRRLPSDDSTLMSNEVAVSSSFSGTVLAALTFLFGFAIGRTQADILGGLALSLILSTFALVAYTNASGELARIRAGSYARHMVVANIVSEFGGVYPLFLFTAAIVMNAVGDSVASAAVSVVTTAVVGLYNASGFDLVTRYASKSTRPVLWNLYRASLLALPILAYPFIAVWDVSWLWTCAVGVTLFAGMGVCLKISDEGAP